jgi:hypothetical protein
MSQQELLLAFNRIWPRLPWLRELMFRHVRHVSRWLRRRSPALTIEPLVLAAGTQSLDALGPEAVTPTWTLLRLTQLCWTLRRRTRLCHDQDDRQQAGHASERGC